MRMNGNDYRRDRVARGLPRKSPNEKPSNYYRKQRAQRLRAWLDDLKVSKGCADCGYNKEAIALDFDHLPEFVKLGTISQMTRLSVVSLANVEAEIEKCEVVCANCHRIRTRDRRLSEAAGESSFNER